MWRAGAKTKKIKKLLTGAKDVSAWDKCRRAFVEGRGKNKKDKETLDRPGLDKPEALGI